MGSNLRVRTSATSLLVLALSLVASDASAGYMITDLGAVSSGGTSIGTAINSSGTVVGSYGVGSSSLAARATSGGGFGVVSLAPIDYAGASTATGINDGGQVTGSFYDTKDGTYHSYLTTNGLATDLGRLDSHPNAGTTVKALSTITQGVNISGQVVGTAHLADGTSQAFTSTGGALTFLPSIGNGQYSQGNGINGGGQLVGTFEQSVGVYHAFLTDSKGNPIDLTSRYTLPGFGVNSYGMAINGSGAVVGYGDFGNNTAHAFLAPALGSNPGPGKIMAIDLGVLSGYTSSKAYGINTNSQVVGAVENQGTSAAFVWDPTLGMIDLRSLLSPSDQVNWSSLTLATAINDGLQITGQGVINGHVHAFELTPVPGQFAFFPTASVPAPPAVVLSALGCLFAAGWARIRPRSRI